MRPLSELSDADSSDVSQVASISADEFSTLAAIFAPFPVDYRFAIAVSGGPDSMALAHCAADWAKQNEFLPIALIVDHGLRPESATEAEQTRARLENIGLQAEILRWQHDPIVTRLHATARKARYQLLTDACRRHGMRDLWLAHQREDQAETILMRLAKGSGIDGLSGIGVSTSLEGIRLLRPFLNIPKERLIVTCHAAKLDFIEDASNRSDQFARGRLRRVMPLLTDEGLTMDRLIDLGARAADASAALDHYTNEALRGAASRDDAGTVFIDLTSLRLVPREIAGRMLGRCLQNIHAESYNAEYVSLTRLLDALRSEEEMTPRTLQGCLVSKTDKQVTILREVAAIIDAPIIRPGESVIWDARWLVTLAESATSSFTIRPLGSPAHETLDALAPGLRHHISRGRARASLPSLWQGETLALIPSLKDEGIARARLVSAWPPG